MSLLLIMLIMLSMSSMFFLMMNHPLSMGLNLIIHTIIISLIISLINNSPWFSFILFLVFLGGMLVLFMYVASLASNEMFSMSSNNTIISFITATIILLMIIMMSPMFINNQENLITMKYNYIPAMKLYNKSMLMITLMLVSLLFIMLVIVTKITSIQQGPLRPSK